jgi:hypothetical protein
MVKVIHFVAAPWAALRNPASQSRAGRQVFEDSPPRSLRHSTGRIGVANLTLSGSLLLVMGKPELGSNVGKSPMRLSKAYWPPKVVFPSATARHRYHPGSAQALCQEAWLTYQRTSRGC